MGTASPSSRPSPVADAGDNLLITREPLRPWHLAESVRTDGCGAVASFVGVVRSPNRGVAIRYLEYEGYEEMIVPEMARIAAELRAAHGVEGVAIAHRLGRVAVGEPSIVVAAASAHRREALAACHAGIDECKARLPIWKLEVTVDGAHWVEGSSGAAPAL